MNIFSNYTPSLFKASLLGATLFTLSIQPSPAVAANLTGSWKTHSAADLTNAHYVTTGYGHMHLMLNTPRYNFFSIRAAMVDRAWGSDINPYFRGLTEVNQLFVFDKSTPWQQGCIKGASSIFNLSGMNVLLADYSADLGITAFVYDNFMVDLIFDDGRIVSSSAIAQTEVPGYKKIPTSINFDPFHNCIYIPVANTIVTISATDGHALRKDVVDMEVTFANRVGDKMLVTAGPKTMKAGSSDTYYTYNTTLYCYDADSPAPKTLADHKLSSSGYNTWSSVYRIIPYSASSGIIMRGSASFANSYMLNFDGSRIWAGQIGSGNFALSSSYQGDNFNHQFPLEAVVADTKDAILVHGSTAIQKIKKNIPVNIAGSSMADFNAEALSTVARPTDNSDETKYFYYSTDNDVVTFYRPRRGFYQRRLVDGVWSLSEEYVWPDGPGHALQHSLVWHPVYGMLGRGPGSREGFGYSEGSRLGYEADDLSGYKDGRWTPYHYTFTSPDLYGSFIQTVSSKTEPTATNGATYIVPDPINPDWVWSSVYSRDPNAGIARMNLADPEDFFMMGITKNTTWTSRFPGFKATFPDYPENDYPNWCAFTAPSFDNAGRMWIARDVNYDFDQPWEYVENSHVPVYWFTADERQSMTKTGAVPTPHLLKIPNVMTDHPSSLLALRAEGNDNILFFSPDRDHNYVRRACIYDHNGTLEDTSDDRIVILDKDLSDQYGERVVITSYTSIWEDVARGEIWLNTKEGPYIINPQDVLAGKMLASRLRVTDTEGSTISFDNIQVKGIDVDTFGRKWIATYQGLYCISADNTTLYGYWTTANSPMPIDRLYAVGCDQATGSVFVGSLYGLTEFRPDDAVGSAALLNDTVSLSAFPANVEADYCGYITLTGAVNSFDYELINSTTDATVINLGKPTEGRLQFTLHDAEGKRLPAGRYAIRPVGSETSLPIRLL